MDGVRGRRAAAETARKKEEQERQRKEKVEADRQAQEDEERAKEAREKKKQERAEAERKKKEEDKKKKEEDKRKKEEEKRKKEEAARAANAPTAATTDSNDKPDDNINDHINDINTGGGDEELDEGAATAGDDGLTNSPQKKKKRKDKKKAKRDKEKEAAEQAKVAKTFADAVKVTPIVRQGKFSKGGVMTAERKALREKLENYDHVHKGWMLELGVELIAEDKHSEFTLALRQCFDNMKLICDKVVIEPAKAGKGTRLVESSDIPFNHAHLSKNVKIDRSDQAFNPRKPWGKNNEDVALEDPVVYFVLSLSSDEEPKEILEGIGAEWSRNNGKKMFLKKVASFKTYTPVVLYHVHNTATLATITAEMEEILKEARDAEEDDFTEEMEVNTPFEFLTKEIPSFSFRLQVPKIPGQDTSVFQGWKNRQQFYRKCLHLECAQDDGPMVEALVDRAKKLGLFARWGKQVKVAVMAADDAEKLDLKNLLSFSRHHIGYNASYIYDGLSGAAGLDKPVPVYSVTDPTKVVCRLTLREILYNHIKLPGGGKPLPLIAEIHQRSVVSSVDVVIPNCEEAESMVAMMNKNLAAYLYYYLQEVAGMEEEFVSRLVQASCDPSLVHEINRCKWNKDTRGLETPEDKDREEEQALQQAAWYNDIFAAKVSGKKKQYVNKALIPNVDDDHSAHTLHKRPGKTYAGTSGAPVFDLSGDSDKPAEESERYLNMSREELIAALGKKEQEAGSRPESEHDKSSSDDSSSSSGSQTSGSSSNKSPTPSAGVTAMDEEAADKG